MCMNGDCIQKNFRCDRDKDCSDLSDEINCSKYRVASLVVSIELDPLLMYEWRLYAISLELSHLLVFVTGTKTND